MRVCELMTSGPDACLPTDHCVTAGQIMRRRHCGFVPVIESPSSRRLIGVVTDRDMILHLVAVDLPPSAVQVSACMTRDPKIIGPDAELGEAAQVMEAAAVRRLPVVDDGRLVGVLSVDDMALAARKQWAHAGPHVAERQMVEVLEAIATARVLKQE